MTWTPIPLDDLQRLIDEQLSDCSDEERALFAAKSLSPTKWAQHPWGNEGGGFWVVAVFANRVLWYNDIEGGFNVSRFAEPGRIPDDEYWCNQECLSSGLERLAGRDRGGFGPPQSNEPA